MDNLKMGIHDYNILMEAVELMGPENYDIVGLDQLIQIQHKIATKYSEANMEREPWGSHENT